MDKKTHFLDSLIQLDLRGIHLLKPYVLGGIGSAKLPLQSPSFILLGKKTHQWISSNVDTVRWVQGPRFIIWAGTWRIPFLNYTKPLVILNYHYY